MKIWRTFDTQIDNPCLDNALAWVQRQIGFLELVGIYPYTCNSFKTARAQIVYVVLMPTEPVKDLGAIEFKDGMGA